MPRLAALFCFSLLPTVLLMRTETDARPWVWLLAGWGLVALGAAVWQGWRWWRAPIQLAAGVQETSQFRRRDRPWVQ